MRHRGYGGPGELERLFSPYEGHGRRLAGLGDTSVPFDLRAPEAVLELKHALVALAQHDSDPLKVADPIQETRWKQIVLTGPKADAWEGAAADELVAAISRYAAASGIEPPYIQLGGSAYGKYGIVGGPQPTANGLEVIAGAVQTKLGGQPAMTRYLTWRDGVFAPPSSVSKPPSNAAITLIDRHGAFWEPHGYTAVWPEGEPQYVDAASQLDESLVACWQQLATMTNASESDRRLAVDDCILGTREAHHQAALLANKGAPTPACPQGQIWDKRVAACVSNTGITDLPPIGVEACIQAYVELEGKTEKEARSICGARPGGGGLLASTAGALGVGAVAGIAIWYFTGRRPRRRA